MKAGRIIAPRQVEIIEVPSPVCADGQATVRLERACLCGSDLPYFAYDFDQLQKSGKTPFAKRIGYGSETVYPLITGLSLHECVGTVIESRSANLSEGDFVLALPFDQNGFYEILTLPEDRIFRLPTGNVSKDEILLSQPLGTVLYGFRKLPEISGQTVAVVGQGPIGQMMTAVLAARGAERVIAIERVPERLALSPRMGATHTIDPSKTDAVSALTEITDGAMADIVIEAVGHRDMAIDLCVDLVRQDGHVFVFGVADTPYMDAYPCGKAFLKNLTISHSVGASKPDHFLPAAELIANGRIDVSPLLTHRFPFADAQTAFETFVDRRDGAVKVLLEF